jgi:O-acetyl-ADP-ribose deacetylase (regulator of RNase III)
VIKLSTNIGSKSNRLPDLPASCNNGFIAGKKTVLAIIIENYPLGWVLYGYICNILPVGAPMKKPILFAIVAIGLVHLYSTTMQPLSLTKKYNMKGITNLFIQQGDITLVNTQAIVNAANEQLAGGGGVCGAIFSAAGWDQMQDACDEYPEVNGVRCPVGEARITGSFDLKNSTGIEYVIHAVGPDCREVTDTDMQNTLLGNAYRNSLIVADKNNITSIAFPFISSAIYACPIERACEVGLKTIADYVNNNPTNIKEVRFVLFSKSDYDLFVKTAEQLGIKG